jgi:hypothetical protein
MLSTKRSPGRNLHGRLARLDVLVGPPPPPPDRFVLASYNALLRAAGPLGNEMIDRLHWRDDDRSKAIFPHALYFVELALRKGWKPVSLGAAWGRLVLDAPCGVSYRFCRACQAPLPIVACGAWHSRDGRCVHEEMHWFPACPGCGIAGEPRAPGLPVGFPDGVEWCYLAGGHPSAWLPRKAEWVRSPY